MTWPPERDRQTPEELQGVADHWGPMLDDWLRVVWPVFRDRGFSKDAAMLVTYGFPGEATDD